MKRKIERKGSKREKKKFAANGKKNERKGSRNEKERKPNKNRDSKSKIMPIAPRTMGAKVL